MTGGHGWGQRHYKEVQITRKEDNTSPHQTSQRPQQRPAPAWRAKAHLALPRHPQPCPGTSSLARHSQPLPRHSQPLPRHPQPLPRHPQPCPGTPSLAPALPAFAPVRPARPRGMAASRQDRADLEPRAAAPEKPCRACTDFRSWMKSQRASSGGGDEAPARPGKV